MRAVLYHNPAAGFEQPSVEGVKKLLKASGVCFHYINSPDERDLARALDPALDFIIIAGGDGTIRKVVAQVFPAIIPIVVIPIGTANNIVKALSLPLIKDFGGLEKRAPTLLDVGLAGEPFFLESVGFGLTARMMQLMHFRNLSHPYFFHYQKRKFIESIRLLRDMLESEGGLHYNLRLDGELLSGEFLFVEVMAISMIGPNLMIAPGADPADGKLDVVVATERDKPLLKSYFRRRLRGEESPLPLQRYRCRSAAVAWEGTDLHVDGCFYKKNPNTQLGITIAPYQLRFLGRLSV